MTEHPPAPTPPLANPQDLSYNTRTVPVAMNEHDPHQPPSNERWSSQEISAALHVPAQPQRDERHGRGARYELGTPEDPVQLVVYPQSRTVQLTMAGARIELSGAHPPHLRRDAIIVTTDPSSSGRTVGLYLNRQAEAVLSYNVHASTALPPDAPIPSVYDPQDAVPRGRQKTQRIRLSGEVKDILYTEPTNPGKVPVLRLSVVSPEEGERVRLFQVYTTKTRAKQFNGMVEIGDHVEIMGLPQQQTRRLPSGVEQVETVIYALGLTKVGNDGPHHR